MKRNLLSIVILTGLFSGAAVANTGEVQFIGAVTDSTCVINPEVGGLIKSTIDLGTMSTSDTQGNYVDFSLVPTTQNCLDKTSGSVGWQSAGFTNVGIANMKGTATGVSVQLTAVNSATPNQDVTYNQQTIQFGSSTSTTALGSLDFKARMLKTSSSALTAGSVIASASYAVAYN